MLTLRQTKDTDLGEVMKIIKQAQKYFRSQGIAQWMNDYPNEQIIKDDMTHGHSYVLLNGEGIVATAVISFDGESDYDQIYEGAWLSHGDFVVIHRIAVEENVKGQGISGIILHQVEKMCKEKGVSSIKIDTHRDNLSMQKFLLKNGFSRCGIIYLKSGSERIAFEKLVK